MRAHWFHSAFSHSVSRCTIDGRIQRMHEADRALRKSCFGNN